MTKTKRKTKPVPLNKMTRKQLLSQLRKVKGKCALHLSALRFDFQLQLISKDKELARIGSLMDDWRRQINETEAHLMEEQEEVARLKGEVARLEKAALL